MGQLSPLFARQPIFDRDLQVVAYELLFRSKDANELATIDGDRASSHVIFYAFGEHDVTEIIGSHKAFINFTRRLLMTPPPLSPDQLVIEVLEDIKPDQEVLSSLRQLKAAGYQIALDDFLLSEESRALLDYADIVKIDVLALSDKQLTEHAQALRRYTVKLVAEKVETYEMLERCKAHGFDYFQGYFLSRPQVIEGVKISDSKSALLQLLGKLVDPMSDFDDLVQTIATDPELTYKILKLVNSASVGLRRQIDSLSHAVAMLGLTQIRNWALFLLLSSGGEKPRELYVLSLTRARFCELLATRLHGRALGEMAFTAGLLSNLDAFLDLPMDVLVEKLHFAEQVESALMRCTGKIGDLLRLVLQHERGAWDEMDWEFLKQQQLTEANLTEMYADAVTWAKQMLAAQE